MEAILEEISELVIDGEADDIQDKVQEALDAGISAQDILDNGLMAGINVVSEQFAAGDVFVPEVLMSAETMNSGVEVIQPLLEGENTTKIGTAIVGTVKGDLHDIGKNLVALMMRAANLEVVALGSDVSAEEFIAAIEEHNPDVVGLSALLTTTMNEQGRIIEAIEAAGIRDKVKVMVGGAPVTQGWADKIKADAFTADAAEAAAWAKNYAMSDK